MCPLSTAFAHNIPEVRATRLFVVAQVADDGGENADEAHLLCMTQVKAGKNLHLSIDG